MGQNRKPQNKPKHLQSTDFAKYNIAEKGHYFIQQMVSKKSECTCTNEGKWTLVPYQFQNSIQNILKTYTGDL